MTNQEIKNITSESLRDWFKKEKWVRITTSGNIAGPCGTSKNKKNPDRCLPKAKAQSLSKAERAATARKKKAAGKKGKTVVANTKKAKVKREGYYSNTQLEDEIRQYGYDSFEQFFADNPGAEEAVFDFIDQNLARMQKEINEVKGLGRRAVDEFSSTLADQILNFFKKHEVLRKEPYQRKYKSGLSDEDYVAETKTFYLGAIINATKKKVMADKTITKETANPQDGKAAPYGSGYKPIKKMKKETKEAPAGHYFTKSGNLVKGRMTRDAKERGARKSDPKDKMRSKVPKVTQYSEMTKEDFRNLIVGTIAELKNEDTIMEKDDRCTRIAKRKYDTWPSAYASGAVVRCRRGEIWKGVSEEVDHSETEIKIGDYQTKHYHMCPGAKSLYQDIEDKVDDMDLAVRTAKLQDALFALEMTALEDGATQADLDAAQLIADQIMAMAEMMGLEKEHNYIQGHVDKIEGAIE